MSESVFAATGHNDVLLAAHRAEFLQQCAAQGMSASEAAACLSDFENETAANSQESST